MTEQQAEGLRRLAAVRKRSQAALMRDALDLLLEQERLERHAERARQALGRYRSGFTDTSERHDDALVEAFGS